MDHPDFSGLEELFRERFLLFARSCIIILFGYYLVSNLFVQFEAATASDWLVRPKCGYYRPSTNSWWVAMGT